MTYVDYEDMFLTAKDFFNENNYQAAAPLLNQLVLSRTKIPDVFHMLGSIFYDQGKFNKAIRSFKRALELDPNFTDSSIGLSIILNDLGRYEEGKEVFLLAQKRLETKVFLNDPIVNEKLANKHAELGELYSNYKRYEDAIEQLYKAKLLSTNKVDFSLQIVDNYLALDEKTKAIKELTEIIRKNPESFSSRIKLGQIYYENNDLPSAILEWENVLTQRPNHPVVKKLLEQAQNLEVPEAGL